MRADIALTDGVVVTMNPRRRVIAEGTGWQDHRRRYLKALRGSLTAGETPDATGQIVSPGLINVHAHALVKSISMLEVRTPVSPLVF